MARQQRRTDTEPKPGADHPAATVEQAATRAVAALAEARAHRHRSDCQCGVWQGQHCTPADGLWTRALNRELDRIIELKDGTT